MQDVIIPIIEHVCHAKPSPFIYGVRDCIQFHDKKGGFTTGYIYDVEHTPGDHATYYYCDAEKVGVYGTITSNEWIRSAPPYILYKLEAWWSTEDFKPPHVIPASVDRMTIARHYAPGEFIGVMHKGGKTATCYIYWVHRESEVKAKYWYCDVFTPGKYGTATTEQIVAQPWQVDKTVLRRWWDEPEFNSSFHVTKRLASFASLDASPPSYKVGDIIRKRVQPLSFDDWDFVTGYVYQVVVEPDDKIKYLYSHVYHPGKYGEAYHTDLMGPPSVALDLAKVRRWWDEPEFGPTYTPRSPLHSPDDRPEYTPIDWETDPIYLAAKAKKTPAFKDFGPEMLSDEQAKKSKKNKKTTASKENESSQSQPKKKSKPFDSYEGISPECASSRLRWGSPPPALTRATEEELACTEDFRECMRP